MTGRKKNRLKLRFKLGPHWLLLVMVMGVLILTSLAFLRSESLEVVESTPSQTATESTQIGETLDSTMTQEMEAESSSPTSEEVGYTDGIIFFSSILVLILLVGTLRETVRREND